MKEITFEYRDAFTNGKWNTQSCVVESVKKCIELYGLNMGDVEYRILEVKEV